MVSPKVQSSNFPAGSYLTHYSPAIPDNWMRSISYPGTLSAFSYCPEKHPQSVTSPEYHLTAYGYHERLMTGNVLWSHWQIRHVPFPFSVFCSGFPLRSLMHFHEILPLYPVYKKSPGYLRFLHPHTSQYDVLPASVFAGSFVSSMYVLHASLLFHNVSEAPEYQKMHNKPLSPFQTTVFPSSQLLH